MRKIAWCLITAGLMLTAIGSWAATTMHVRVADPAGNQVDPTQLMMTVHDLPTARYIDYSLVND
jgi:hypothetical protein